MNISRNQQHAQQLTSGPLLLSFERLADRWAHTIFWQTESQRLPIFESQEGSSDQAWPPSPPLQEIHFETRGDSCVAMGVGMSGSSHWSICISANPQISEFRFEVACRAKQLPQFLGSSYRTLPAYSEVRSLKFAATFGRLIVNKRIDPEPVEQGAYIPNSLAATIQFLPAEKATTTAGTSCWNYVLSLV